MKTIYECSRSKAVNWLTAFCFIFILAAIGIEIWCMTIGENVTVGFIVIFVLLFALLSTFFVYPQYVVSTDEGIGIHMLLHTKMIPYSDIDRIERVEESVMKGWTTIRLFGIGGFFGFIGWFRSPQIGTYLAFITDPKKVFLIYRKSGKPVAISVSEPDDFMPYFLKNKK